MGLKDAIAKVNAVYKPSDVVATLDSPQETKQKEEGKPLKAAKAVGAAVGCIFGYFILGHGDVSAVEGAVSTLVTVGLVYGLRNRKDSE